MAIDEQIQAPRVEAERKEPWDEEDEKPEGINGLIKEIKDTFKKADEKEGKGVS